MILLYVIGIVITLLQCFKKWGWLDIYEAYRKKWMPEAGCYLCLGFWLSIPVTVIVCIVWLNSLDILLVPFVAAGIINSLANENN